MNASKNKLQPEIDKIISRLGQLIPEYSANPADAFAHGNVAVCIIDEAGNLYGKIWGDNKVQGRTYARLAWIKATQVWITGMKTGEYEKRLFNGEFEEEKFGITKPDLIGWEGGQPVTLKDGSQLAIGFSGFRGINDLEIVLKAVGYPPVSM